MRKVWAKRRDTGEIFPMGTFRTKAEAGTFQGLAKMDDFEDEVDFFEGDKRRLARLKRRLRRK